MKNNFLTLSILSFFYTSHAGAVVCTDPTGNSLHIQEMAKDAALWAEEKSMWVSGMASDKALSIYETMKNEYFASASISSQTTAVSSTANAAAEERYATSPSACETFTRVKAFADSFETTCENPVTEAMFEHTQAQIADCGVGGSGLNCGRVDSQRSLVTNKLAAAIDEQDGDKLVLMLDGAQLLGLSDSPMRPENNEENAVAFALLLGMDEPKNLPRNANGTLPDGTDKHSSKRMSDWATEHVYRSVANSALTKVKQMYEPTGDGKASLMAQLKERVDYYNSPDFLKLLTNTNDKRNLPSNWDMLTPAQKHDWNQNAPADQQLVSSEQVLRMLGEMKMVSLQLEYLTLESAYTNTSLNALQLKLRSL
ncbi:conserved exported hypothetical protein [Vibrio nigripulchritudo SOn1]|uniref:Uncharacterized protein n=1 Tax=Vibrio nigripulchritudo SOn1 TaxID=1238450 RepID=A0AAV2VQ24_9VIBR|nr:hypothetical protein [Vibrio nigripulchritudo]CCO46826.1 conserved exported hypothetical protein [Vibrio nigripulchritudo SOn1]